MMTVEEMNAIRRQLGWSYQKLSEEAGVPVGTVQKILGGITKNPRVETMNRLEDTLARNKWSCDQRFWSDYTYEQVHSVRETPGFETGGSGSMRLKDGVAFDRHHRYSVAERDALPEWRRTELIEGVLYDMASPRPAHQITCSMFYDQINTCIKKHHRECFVFIAPTDVCLFRDNYTMLVPDVFVVCDRTQITEDNIQGAPAFIMEVLSPSTAGRDVGDKLCAYLEAGVREYWIVDPDRRRVVVHTLADDSESDSCGKREYTSRLYTFQDRIPLTISGGKCVIDMNPIRETLDELFT